MDSLSPHRHLSLSHLLLFLLLVSSNLLTFFLFSSRSTSCSPSLRTPSISLSSSPPSNPSLPSEFLAFTSPQPLPFGHNHNFDSATLHPPIGLPCPLFPSDLPFPLSLWSLPPDNSVHWSAYSCKSFACLVDRKHSKSFDDCKDCFDLDGREKHRWVNPSSNPLDFTIDEALAAASPSGSIRIGLDIGGGSGTFAVRMKERNVTIVTTSMNLNGPFNSFIAARGVVPLYISVSQRLPFFDNTLDIVHSMHVLSNWIPTTLLHFIMFDVYRVLRPGGLFWLDHFFFVEEQMEEYVPVIESVGFKKVRWEVGRKLDRGPELREMYISALLEKPLNDSW
ncbi:hypothetical protein COCNU_02G005480 [Cocos nucifera]|uniref:Methyltransferase type 11 domain-containing protein n=1 Tax=Cocos nucifera TaxID=13894 RepID=A0A8K0HYP1_COCNU|nr:hypothetical protein COCNU_02G005480 [Cocos nucifera]